MLITTLSLWFSLAGRNGFYLSEEPQAKNGFVARVAQRRGLSQGRQKGVYFRLNDRSKSWGDFTDFWESELLPRVVRIIRHAGRILKLACGVKVVLLISRGCQQRGAAKKRCGKDLIRRGDQRACFREIWAETNPRYSVQKVL